MSVQPYKPTMPELEKNTEARKWKLRRGDKLDDQFRMGYFELLKGQYATLPKTVQDLEAESEAKSIAAMNPSEVEWEQLYRLELAILKLEPHESLKRKAWLLRDEYKEIAKPSEVAAYEKSGPPDPEKASEPVLRADLVKIQEELNWAYLALWAQEEFRKRLTFWIVCWTSGAIALIAGIYVLVRGFDLDHSVSYLAAVLTPVKKSMVIAAIAGLLGGAISTLRRIQTVEFEDNPDINLAQLERLSILVSPVMGAVFAVVLYFILASQLLDGAMFPKKLLDGQPPRMELAKLIVWSFIAGFAETFVPDRLKSLSEAGSNAGASKK